MKTTWTLTLLAVILSAAGVYLSYQLLAKHMHVPGGPQWLNAICEPEHTGGVSCDKVLSSRWGMFPRAEPGQAPTTRQLPVALIGLAYFTAMFTWLTVVGRPNRRGRYWHVPILILNVAGLVGSVDFIRIMAVELDTWCPLCVATHVINFLLFIVNVLLWPRKPKTTSDQAPLEAAPPIPAHPGPRLAIVTIVFAFMLAQLETKILEVAVMQRQYKKMAAVVKEVQGNVNTLISMHLAADPKPIDIRPDDPIRYMHENAPTVVVWSDFECPHCRKFAVNFEKKYAPHFDGFLRLVYKHYPVCSDCNPYVKRRAHLAACNAARLAEAVRTLAGNDAFWTVHDMLFDDARAAKGIEVTDVAELLETDAQKLIETMGSEDVQKRIADDIEQAHQLGVKATPAVFLEGREVTNLAREVDGFWRTIGAKVQLIRDARKPS